ncbi:MAG: hypothetical protein VX772_08225, partial [Bacteroidota bacterium]|nr:hypothetical protein [Bacteroidota bacterium]
CFLMGCHGEPRDKADQIRAFYQGFQNSDYTQIKSTISDSLAITEGDYVMRFTPKSYYEQFKWDSIFEPHYTIISINEVKNAYEATVAVESKRFDFLKNNPLTCTHRFNFKSDKINMIENLDCSNANWQIWQQQRDSLVTWIKKYHPELDGFVHDLSMKGAQNYLKAIELYKNHKDTIQ